MKELICPELQLLLEPIRPQTWQEVMEHWQKDEAQPAAKSVYNETTLEDWPTWRNRLIEPLHLDQLDWELFIVIDPLTTVPHFHGGPFRPWQEQYYGDQATPTFTEIVSKPGTDICDRSKFSEILSSAVDIRLVGLVLDGDIYIIEGMHRCVALALAAVRQQDVKLQVETSLALADVNHFPLI